MAKRVLQADGTYCYTENCRIHNRGALPAIGGASVVDDASRTTRLKSLDAIQEALTQHKNLYKTKKSLEEASEQIVDTFYNANNTLPFAVANISRVALLGEDKGFQDTYDWDRMVELSTHMLDGIKAAHRVDQNSRVVIAATGETGTVSETHNLLASKPFRVHTDDFGSRNDFKFFSRSELVKVDVPEDDAPTRKWVAYAKPDETLLVNAPAELLRQESDPARYNAQALRGIAPKDHAAVRAELGEIADKWDRATVDRSKGVTKSAIARFLKDEAGAARPWLTMEESENVRDAISNILAYVAPEVKVPRITRREPVEV
jgi:hypothetical protein